MKTSLTRAAALLAVAFTLNSPAELVIYRGTEQETITGNGLQQRLSATARLIVDRNTADVRLLISTTINGQKLYATGSLDDLQIVEVTDYKGKTTTALVRTQDDCDVEEGRTSVSVVFQGPNASLKVQTNSTISFPKTLSGGGSSYGLDDGELVTAKLAVSFDQAATQTANSATETVDQCLQRLAASLEARGYHAITGKASRVETMGGLKEKNQRQ